MAFVSFRVDRCKGCSLCVAVCPRKIIQLQQDTLNAKGFHPAGIKQMDRCIGCAACAIMCPDSVIEVER